jgi:hypothetical protein
MVNNVTLGQTVCPDIRSQTDHQSSQINRIMRLNAGKFQRARHLGWSSWSSPPSTHFPSHCGPNRTPRPHKRRALPPSPHDDMDLPPCLQGYRSRVGTRPYLNILGLVPLWSIPISARLDRTFLAVPFSLTIYTPVQQVRQRRLQPQSHHLLQQPPLFLSDKRSHKFRPCGPD